MIMPLYIKTHNSLLNSMIRIDELVLLAKERGYQALALADSNFYGVIEFYKACEKQNMKPIIGLEITYEGKPVVLYAQNEGGYRNLLKLATLLSDHQITIETLTQFSDHLICLIPFESRTYYDLLKPLYAMTYQGYTNKGERDQLIGNNLVYLNEVLCLKPEEQSYLPYLYGIKDGLILEQVTFLKQNNDLLHYEIGSITEEDQKNNEEIMNACQVSLPHEKDLLPIYDCPNGMDQFTYLKQLCKEGLKRIFGEMVPKAYIERLKYELEVIHHMGFCNYFLVVWDYVKYAKEHDVLVGPGRGSAAGSLVSYCLNITTIDPMRYQLFFERFLNPERITMPDIDIDFEYQRREEIIQYCIQKYGMKKVAPIITFGTLGAKQVIRDVGRVMDVDLKHIDRICKLLDSRLTLMENYNQDKKLREYLEFQDEFKKLYKVALKFEGLKRHTSIHAAGIVMCNRDLDEIIPLDRNHDGFYTTGFSMDYLEELGLLKMDFLALRNLTLIHDCINDINQLDPSLNFDTIPLGDPLALSIFTNVDTIGIFQFESQGMMNFLRKFRPETFEDIVAAISLFRPGPMDNIDTYIKRRKGKETYDFYHEDLMDILKPTYGVLIYQEQIMQVASILAGYSLGEADILRRAMSKKKESVLLSEKEKFILKSVERGYDQELATKVYHLILKFANYGFNRAHAVSYSMIAYKMAYLKAHYPQYFIKNLLTMVIGSEGKTKEYIYECKLHKIDVLKPDINLSGEDYIIQDQGILFPLSCIKNVGINAVRTILEERQKGPFTDIFDFVKRTYGKSINRKTIESLIDAGVFLQFGLNRNTLSQNLDAIINYGEIGELLDNVESLKPVFDVLPEYDKKELMLKELAVFGFYLSNHPVTEYKLQHPECVSLSELDNYFDSHVSIIVYVDRIKEIATKKESKMCFITGSDEIMNLDIVLFPRIYEQYPDITPGDILLLQGKVEKRFDKLQLVVNELTKLEG